MVNFNKKNSTTLILDPNSGTVDTKDKDKNNKT
jgi:phospholipase C